MVEGESEWMEAEDSGREFSLVNLYFRTTKLFCFVLYILTCINGILVERVTSPMVIIPRDGRPYPPELLTVFSLYF